MSANPPLDQTYYQDPGLFSAQTVPATWLDNKHPEWLKSWYKWRYARDVYTGEVLDPDKLGSYLIRKGTGETLPAYYERQALADFTSFFGVCADALAGMLFHVEDDATRNFADLGKADDPASVSGKLYRNADGANTGYSTIWKQFGIELVITHCHWVLVDVVDGAPRLTLIEPERVVDWLVDESGLAMVKVLEHVDVRTSLEQAATQTEQFLVFDRKGWQRYRQVGKGSEARVETVGPPGVYHYEDAAGKAQLPIFRVEMPLRRNVGYPLARKNIAIFNKESERDHLLRAANFPKLFVVGDDEVFKKIAAQIAAGAFVVQEDPTSQKTHRFDAPPTTSAEVATKVLEQKAQQFFKTFFREYADTAQEKTATEVRQDVASGVGAFLQMLRAGLDDAENETLWRLEQAVFPNDRTKWFKARVNRSANFQPLNVDEEIERLRIRYFGQTTPVPIGRAGKAEVIRQIAAWDGLEVNDQDASAALDNHELMETLDLLDKRVLPLPAEALAQLVVRWLERLGVVTPEQAPAMLIEATRVAKQNAQAQALLAQPPGPPPAGPNEPAKPVAKPTPSVTRITREAGGFVVTKGQ